MNIADKLCEVRKKAQRVYGDRYPDLLRGGQEIIRSYAAKLGVTPITAAIEIAQQLTAEYREWDALLMLVVSAEMVEPSTSPSEVH